MLPVEFRAVQHQLEQLQEWHKWANEIPYIQWPHGWLVKAIPPHTYAVLRYWITKPKLQDAVSVYLDCYDALGHFGEPYWEVYPYNDDVFRCKMADTKSLLRAIKISLMQLRNRRNPDANQS